MKFITFWIPLEYSVDFNKVNLEKNNKKSKNITDKVEKRSNILNLEIKKNNNINLKYQDIDMFLEFYSYNEHGFFTYTIKDKIDEELLKIQVYHIFKEFYHTHKGHAQEEDSLIEAIILDNFDINKIKKHYIDGYLSKFENYKSIIEEYLLSTTLEKYDYQIDMLSNLKNLILKAKNELNFAKFLSKQELEYEQFLSIEKSLDNFYNRLTVLETNKIIRTNDNINKWQFILAILGLILGLIGTYFGFYGATESLQNEILKVCK